MPLKRKIVDVVAEKVKPGEDIPIDFIKEEPDKEKKKVKVVKKTKEAKIVKKRKERK